MRTPFTACPAALVVAAFASLAVGCGGGGSGPSPTPTKLAFTGQPSNTPAGAAITPALKVAVQGAAGSTISSSTAPITITLQSSPAGGTLAGTDSVNATSGVATFSDLSIGQPGAGYTLVAASSGLTSATSAPFNIFGAAALIASNAGDGQTAPVGTPVATPPSVIVTDAAGVPVPNVAVTFEVTAGGGTVSPTTPVSTDGGGVAAVNSWTLGASPVMNTLSAAAGGLAGSPVTFTAMGTPPQTLFTVSVVNNQFLPKNQTVPVGSKVRWVWATGARNHTVTPDATQPPRSGDPVDAPFTYEFTFNTPGTFQYFCEVHGNAGGVGMSGTITVTP